MLITDKLCESSLIICCKTEVAAEKVKEIGSFQCAYSYIASCLGLKFLYDTTHVESAGP